MSGRGKAVFDRFVTVFATGLGLGYLPLVPGTFGTLLGIPICLLFYRGGWIVYVVGTLVLIAAGVWAADRADRIFGVHDSRKIVVDEICGFLVTMALVVPGVLTIGIGFVLFRFFDIVKPFPVGYLDRKLPGGWGVMLDDIAAGVYANILLHVSIITIDILRPGTL